MKAIILAAGMGSRLKNITKDKTKCMVEVNGESLIKRLLKQLEKYTLEEIVIVTGYKEEILKNYINNLDIRIKIKFYNNDIYDKTNNIYSLGLVEEELLNNDILLIESDLIFEDKLLENIINSSYKNLAVVSEYESWMDGTCVRLDDENNVVDFISSQRFSFNEVENLYKTVNIYKLSKEFNQKYYIPFLKAYISSKGTNQYYESVFETLIKIIPNELKGLKIEGLKWYEIDDKQDLDIAESLFAKEDKLSKFQVRYGGYWRYPKLLDYCYLVNPYFPPKKMIDELKMNFQELLTQYPSGLKVNNLLASKYFNIDERYIVVGNGAAELIKGLLNILEGSLGVIRPTFEEYPNRYSEDSLVIFNVENNEYRYSSSNIIEYFDDKKIENLILINPDNPSGNYISKIEVLNLLEWGKKKNIKLIIDESFVDFAIEENSSLLTDDILNKFSNLIVVKSISKSYGVPGLRLGVIATSDISIINKLKKEVSIWNINSFAEYYMQIYNKYEKLYKKSLDKIKISRKNFIRGLKEIEELAVLDSEANYVMVKILEKYTSKDLAEILLNKYDILIKDLKGKKGINDNYIRLAIRDEKDNNYCLRAIKEIFKARG
ncbi:aminotransferase class I/II-fold pyridoxal phosphate-dependent enzyme [Fusobacterium mortiferum]|uniref:aminotransferase class I/II-fold pyridoxal phosphate-dependent enzyme n=1 Tax=Fusobacterium mortiferum TaxID=850 RepID=UPI00195D7601|nr:aminotransferase class I/II-fold pyridoxal phosphate-dependent enzyme [Fusobacterium mortiferum]